MGEGFRAGPSLRFYRMLARVDRLGYCGKIMLVAGLGIHLPLLALGASVVMTGDGQAPSRFMIVSIAFVATLVGTLLTMLALRHLLAPVELTAASLRTYAEGGELPALPTRFEDCVGRLMADTMQTLYRLDGMLDEFEHRDPVTGLGNRAALLRTLQLRTAPADSRPFALCIVDIHGLTDIASLYGQQEADRILLFTVARLGRLAHLDGTLFRISQNRLAFIAETGDPGLVTARLAACKGCLDRADPNDTPHLPSSRLGVALWPIDDSQGAALIDDANVAVDLAHRRGARWAFYSDATRRSRIESYQLEQDLQLAIDRDELRLHFQPVVDSADGRIVSAEALLRWQHPRLGLLLPRRFIALAEADSLITRIGLWTLAEVCRQTRIWRDIDLQMPPIAVNLSARQFIDPDLPECIEALVDRYGILPGSVEIELTETSAASDVEQTRKTMMALRTLGIRLSIDDFGTGHASLSHLRALPFDKLKIDREFVRQVDTITDNRAICRSLLSLGKELSLSVVAEGVETREELRTLEKFGCHLFQGFYFHRPLDVDDFVALMREPKRGNAHSAPGKHPLNETMP